MLKIQNMLLISGLIVLSAATCMADSEAYFKDPKHPGKCAIKPDMILSPGETADDLNVGCGRILCLEDGLAAFQSCKLHDRVPYCPDNKRIVYPDCCVLCAF